MASEEEEGRKRARAFPRGGGAGGVPEKGGEEKQAALMTPSPIKSLFEAIYIFLQFIHPPLTQCVRAMAVRTCDETVIVTAFEWLRKKPQFTHFRDDCDT